jgi:hypothetical protein
MSSRKPVPSRSLALAMKLLARLATSYALVALLGLLRSNAKHDLWLVKI